MAFSNVSGTVVALDDRVGRFVEAARELGRETGSAAFTVPQLVARAGLSLKSFYACFDGKDDLLVALLAADSEVGAELLAERLAVHRGRKARLQAYVEDLFALLGEPGAIGYATVLSREHRRLEIVRPQELGDALAPLVQLLADEIAGPGPLDTSERRDVRATAELVFALILEGIHRVTVGREAAHEVATRLWTLCWDGLSARPSSRRTTRKPTTRNRTTTRGNGR